MVRSDQQSAPKQLINEVPSHVVLVNNKVGVHIKLMITNDISYRIRLNGETIEYESDEIGKYIHQLHSQSSNAADPNLGKDKNLHIDGLHTLEHQTVNLVENASYKLYTWMSYQLTRPKKLNMFDLQFNILKTN